MRRSIYLTAIFFCAVLAVCRPAGVQAQAAAASYQALNWDKEMTLPPGAYRASKPIDINGDFTVKTQSGTLIEASHFHGRSGVQHWHIEGTSVRQVLITGKRNASGHAIDSAFEDFEFNKDDNWYNFWWSTRWRFDNCIFTKKFLRGDLPPLDYSAHATNCTFYGVKLPPVGFKENPANYMQKEDMVFEHCRFVDCDVPQTFLASTVDCVFERCRFEPKNKLVWPKETGPIKVTAYYGGDNEQKSFINGPLSVEFLREPMGGGRGSTLAHTQSGGRITLTNLRLSGQTALLGTKPKKASEIVEGAAPLPPVAAVTAPVPAGPATPAAPTAPALDATIGVTVHSMEEMLRAMPPNIEVLTTGGGPNLAGVEAANRWLLRTYAGRAAVMRLTLDSAQAINAEGYSYQANGRSQGLLYHGATIPARAGALFRPAAAAALARVQRNADFNLRGVVREAKFAGQGHALMFTLSVGEAQVSEAIAAPTAPREAAAPPPSAADPALNGSSPAQIIGPWTVVIRKDGGHWEQTYNADNTCTSKGERFATWEIKDDQFIVRFNSGGGVDTYDLPVRNGVMYGKNLDNWSLALVRPDLPVSTATKTLLSGTWDFYNRQIDRHFPTVLDPDQTFSFDGNKAGRWLVLANALVFEWTGHSDWNDIFELPGKDGALQGANGFRADLTMTRKPAASTPTAPVPIPGDKSKPSYFGTMHP